MYTSLLIFYIQISGFFLELIFFFFCFADIVACPDYLTWGVSFDDGPSVNSTFIFFYVSSLWCRI